MPTTSKRRGSAFLEPKYHTSANFHDFGTTSLPEMVYYRSVT